MSKFEPTHEIKVTYEGGRVETVKVAIDGEGAGPAYTQAEWEAGAAADWERDAEGTWTFQGRAHPGVGEVAVKAL